MLDPNQILSEWKDDCQLDEILIDTSALQIACLHSKYVVYLTTLKKQLRYFKRKKKEFPATERRGSTEYSRLEELISEHDDVIDATERIIYSINQFSFTLNTIVKWRCHLKGVDIT